MLDIFDPNRQEPEIEVFYSEDKENFVSLGKFFDANLIVHNNYVDIGYSWSSFPPEFPKLQPELYKQSDRYVIGRYISPAARRRLMKEYDERYSEYVREQQGRRSKQVLLNTTVNFTGKISATGNNKHLSNIIIESKLRWFKFSALEPTVNGYIDSVETMCWPNEDPIVNISILGILEKFSNGGECIQYASSKTIQLRKGFLQTNNIESDKDDGTETDVISGKRFNNEDI